MESGSSLITTAIENRPLVPGWWCEEYGAERDRTADLVNAIHALSQLSYCPERRLNYEWEALMSRENWP